MSAADLERVLRHPILGEGASDAEIAAYLRIPERDVRRARERYRRELLTSDLRWRLDRLRAAIEWEGTDSELLVHVVEAYRVAFARYQRTEEVRRAA